MNQTVVGVFRDAQDSQQVVQQLEALGLDRRQIDLAVGATYAASAPEREDGLTRFFKSLLGDGDDARRHTEVAREGAVVTVHAASEDEARRAALILDRYGACDFGGGNLTEGHYAGTGQSGRSSEQDTTDGEIGNVRLHSRIIDHSVEEADRLREVESPSAGASAAPMDTPGTGFHLGNDTGASERRDTDDSPTRGLVGGDSDRLGTGSSNPISGDLSETGSSRFRDNS